MNLANLVGQTIDEKYKIERELGKGGMGAVYLATHIGTERPVAVKVIVPQFMQKAEFVERFKREARAAGRLRHPNVVDVTDFGFDETPQGRVAYLVMEYLDGCTLGEILEEERRLPLEWSLDILEQVSSAIQTAHEQGIIHRDLKPDNIWLEPNQRGGYTVKVLDFGIAKLEENIRHEAVDALPNPSPHRTQELAPPNKTVHEANQTGTIAGAGRNSTIISDGGTIAQTKIIGAATAEEAGTLIQPIAEIDLESGTAILPAAAAPAKSTFENQDALGTRLMSAQVDRDKNPPAKKSTAELTRVGAVLGTPLYMSPEQCRGEKLDPRSDIYSLAVIAYQMLSGKTPFEGDYKAVMNAHIEDEPPPLNVKKIPKKVMRAIRGALSKKPEQRPQTAEIFASQLRSHSEGFGKLLQRSLIIYSQHLPTFLWVSFLLLLPVIVLTIAHVVVEYLALAEVIPMWMKMLLSVGYVVGAFFLGIWFGSALIGVITWMVAQILAAPLKQISWRPAIKLITTKWKSIVGTVTLGSFLSFLGLIFGIPLGIILFSYWFVRLLQSYITKKENRSSLRIKRVFRESFEQPSLKSLLIFSGKVFFFILIVFSGLFWSVRFGLVSPILMMENLRGRVALKRSSELTERVYWTAVATMLIYLILPIIISSFSAKLAGSMVNFDDDKTVGVKFNQDRKDDFGIQINSPDNNANQTATKTEGQKRLDDKVAQAREEMQALQMPESVQREFDEAVEKAQEVEKAKAEKDAKPESAADRKMARRIAATIKETLVQIFWLPISILLGSFSSITFALLYLKTRQAGGESMNDLLKQFESADDAQSNWQKRVRKRLIQSGRITSKT